jgi:integrase
MIRRTADAAGLGDIKPHAHMLRHSCGYAMARDNENPLRIQAWLGHRDPSNTAIYVDLSAVQFKGVWKGRG